MPVMPWEPDAAKAPNGVLLGFWREGYFFSRYHVVLHTDGEWQRWPVRSDKLAPEPDAWMAIPEPMSAENCNSCGGVGFEPDGNTCPICGGSG